MSKRQYVKIEIWGVVPQSLDDLVASGVWGVTREEVYYNLAMERLRELLADGKYIRMDNT